MKNLNLIKKLIRTHSKLPNLDIAVIGNLKRKSSNIYNQARNENENITDDFSDISQRIRDISSLSTEEYFDTLYKIDRVNTYICNKITMKYCKRLRKL